MTGIELLMQAVEEYNEVQPNEEMTLDWWDDVIDTLKDRNDEKEIKEVTAAIKEATLQEMRKKQ